MERFERDGLTFDVADSGPEGGDPVVLLHGWPQDHTAYDRVVPLLHQAGLRTLVPDQRGYSPGAMPRRRGDCAMSELTADILALLDAAGLESAHLVGHDWGGAVAWAVAERWPERVRTLSVLATPHHDAMAWAMRHGGQARKSWYMLAFQLPWLPELVVPRMAMRFLTSTGLGEVDARRYAARLADRAAVRGGLAWYRDLDLFAEVRRMLKRRNGSRPEPPVAMTLIAVPTTFVWGSGDVALGRAAAERTRSHVGGDYRFVELDAGHWLPETEPAVVASEILARARG